MPTATNRATGRPVTAKGDQTAVLAQALEAKKLADAVAAAAEAEELADVESFEKKNVVIDYFENADTPLPEVQRDEIEDNLPYRIVTMKYEIDNMAFGRKIIRMPEFKKDEDGNDTWEMIRPAELGGIQYFSFAEGRRYKLPRELADHLDEHGYLFH